MKRVAGFFMIVTLCMLAPVMTLTSQTVYANDWDGGIHILDLRHCNSSYLSTSLTYSDIALQGGSFYGVQGWNIHKIDVSSGADTLIAAYPQSIFFTGMAGDGLGNLYLAETGSNLYRFEIASGLFHYVGNAGVSCQGDLAFLGDTIYMLGMADTLVRITLNPFSSTIVGVMNLDTVPHSNYGIVPALEPNTLYVSAGYTNFNKLFKVNATTAAATVYCDTIGTITTKVFGLATDAEDVGSHGTPTEVKNSVSLFPNPVCDHLVLQWPDNLPRKYIIRILTMQGHQVFIQEAEIAGTWQMDASNLPPGMYLLSILTDNGRQNHRFTVVR